MLYSEDRKFVFVAVPKTGTTSIQRRLCEVDPKILRNRVHDSAGVLVKMRTHATSKEIRSVMGERSKEFTFVAFLRDPRDAIVSKYHFYRSGRAAREYGLFSSARLKEAIPQLGITLRVLSAQLLPLPIWARFYPFPHAASCIVDAYGNLIVDRLGTTERLQEDVMQIFGEFGYTLGELQLSNENRTEYKRIRDSKIVAIVERRLSKDCALYDQIQLEKD